MADAEYRIEPTAPWVDKVPRSWKFYKGKYIFGERFEKGNDKNLELLSPTQKYGVIPQTLYDELSGMRAVKVKEDTDLSGFKTVHKGDFCISLRSFQGGFEYSEYEGVVSPAYHILYSKMPISDGYYKYLFKEQSFISEMNSYCQSLRDGKNISYDDFGKTVIPYPSLFEQQAIADYLDDRCSKIDEIITEATASIEEYKELKQAVIFEAVTKGLDKNAPMKDSGVDWIGDIPAHWNYVALKRIYDYSNGSAVRVGPFGSALPSSAFVGEGEWVYNQRTVLDNNFVTNNTFVTKSMADSLESFKVFPDDILVTTRGSVGRIARVPDGCYSGILHPCIIRFRIDKKKYNYDLLRIMFNESDFMLSQILRRSNATIIDVLYSYSLKELKIPMMPMQEQSKIVAYLTCKCGNIDALISEKQSLIEDLQAYKKSLIYEVVTGKRRVV